MSRRKKNKQFKVLLRTFDQLIFAFLRFLLERNALYQTCCHVYYSNLCHNIDLLKSHKLR